VVDEPRRAGQQPGLRDRQQHLGDGYSVDPRLNVALADYNLVRAGARRYGPHDVAADPRFTDPAADRFDVLASSAAVDSGVAGAVATIRGAAYSVPATDLLGGARTGAPDRGAYELGGGVGDPPVPAADALPAPAARRPEPRPSRADRLRAALAACTKRRTRAARARCRTAALGQSRSSSALRSASRHALRSASKAPKSVAKSQ
jgi:hypothetical protein